ncbi:polyhydroxyalkanoic acid system protein [Thiohalocapsa marina]|uniref:Polyhydroxyalkanoic acid system protein n=1 Tax=Thiohalocapsa marina TaxID=424902 RepID=A0A5M8FQ89_9GAMM|nr:polyhydroxyalkanoic acid system family protein [Thiohalocapsa marina]KAA6186927.1 polyhydroxyalkanoic acid system protein [Thiohalocapsa marina]
MSNIRVTREHRLGLELARQEVERIAQRVHADFGAEYAWEGDTLSFARTGISGLITVTDDCLELDIKLGFLLSALRGQIEHGIVSKIDERLARYDSE